MEQLKTGFSFHLMIGKLIAEGGVELKLEKIYWKVVLVILGTIINKLAYINKAFKISLEERI